MSKVVKFPQNQYVFIINVKYYNLVKYHNRVILLTWFGQYYHIRVVRGMRNIYAQPDKKLNLVTRLKLGVDNETNERFGGDFARWWSDRHGGSNFFSVENADNVVFIEPWIAEIDWPDFGGNLNFIISVKFLIASVQTSDLLYHYTHLPLLTIIIETFIRHDDGSLEQIDAYSCDMLIFLHRSGVPGRLFRLFGNENMGEYYVFDKWDENWAEKPEKLKKLFIRATRSETLQIRKFIEMTKGQHCDRLHFVNSPNFQACDFQVSLKDAIKSDGDMFVTNEIFQLNLNCLNIQTCELICVSISLDITDPLFDTLGLDEELLQRIFANNPENRNKFLDLIVEKTLVGDNVVDYRRYKDNLRIEILWLPSSPIKASLQIQLTRNELIDWLRKHYKKEQYLIFPETMASDPTSEPKIPLKAKMNITFKSHIYRTFLQQHAIDINVIDRDVFIQQQIYDLNLSSACSKDYYFSKLNKIEHVVINQDGVETSLEKSEFCGGPFSFNLNNCYLKRKNNDTPNFVLVHYPDLKKAKVESSNSELLGGVSERENTEDKRKKRQNK